MGLLRKIACIIFSRLYFDIIDGTAKINVRSRGMLSFIRVNKTGNLIIGQGTTIGPFTRIACSQNMTIEKDVSIAQNCYIADHQMDYKSKGHDRQVVKYYSRECIIKEGAWLGVGSVVLNSKIGKDSVVGANSTVINFDVPNDHVFIGDSRLKYSLRKINYSKDTRNE
ncbi:MAG: hypothetical protein IH934_03525 [Nanoarchaeota archaeon]|nr:hypothetical protein [Nanoarchaeota archaeon]